MIEYTKGNILNCDAEAIVNTVNTVGVMGKGIALQFKNAFPTNYKEYEEAAKKKKIQIGKMFVTETAQLVNPKYIINFPTKKHWRYPSKIEYIEEGIKDLRKIIESLKLNSIAIPPLGAGNGGLNWTEVKEIIEQEFGKLNLQIIIYEPSDLAYRETYQKKRINRPLKLTNIRAMVLELFFEYKILGDDPTLLEAQKLVYFLQRSGENLNLNFAENIYGPFSEKLIHVLYDMDGYYLTGTKSKDAKPMDRISVIDKKKPEIGKYISGNLTDSQRNRLDLTMKLINGYEFPLGMELLSTLDFIITRNIKYKNNFDKLVELVHAWSQRKKELMKVNYLEKAYSRLLEFDNVLYKK